MNRQITLPYGHESRVEGPKDAPPVPGLREAVDSRPADRDLRQGFKPVNNCGMVVKDGGTLILLIPAPEGIAPDHTQLVDFGTACAEEVLAMVAQ